MLNGDFQIISDLECGRGERRKEWKDEYIQ